MSVEKIKAFIRRNFHRHTDRCYGAYEPCGEHHVHSGPPDPPHTWCGNKRLICHLKEDEDLLTLLDYTEMLEKNLESVIDKGKDLLLHHDGWHANDCPDYDDAPEDHTCEATNCECDAWAVREGLRNVIDEAERTMKQWSKT